MDEAVLTPLLDAQLTERAIASRLDVSRSTVRYWLNHYGLATRGNIRRPVGDIMEPCPTEECAAVPPTPAADYVYLLGLYLGDGSLQRGGRASRLGVTLDDRYPLIQGACARAMMAVSGRRVWRRQKPGCTDILGYWGHWPCVLPHGRGRKHLRQIELVSWQQQLVDAYQQEFIRGLIHSDGCRYTNVVKGRTNGQRYGYPTYQFSNRSDDIHRLFQAALSGLNVRYRKQGCKTTIARRVDVMVLDAFVGPKA